MSALPPKADTDISRLNRLSTKRGGRNQNTPQRNAAREAMARW
jgi:hypothetical protein